MGSSGVVFKPLLLALALIVGGVLGVAVSMVVNLALVEISISPFFSMYFGILFVIVGGLILWRVISHDTGDLGDVLPMKKLHLSVFAGTIVFSGFLCFLLDRRMFVGLSSWMKVPLYTVLGLSVAFALTFSIVDMMNYLLGYLRSAVAKPLVESTHQVYLVLLISMAMGAVFGCVFGMLDVEDEQGHFIRIALMREENYCYPVGMVLGSVGGLGNEYMRQKEDYSAYAGIGQTEFDDDI